MSPARNFGLVEALLKKPIVHVGLSLSARASPGTVGSLYDATVRVKNHGHEPVEASIVLSCRAIAPHQEPDAHLRPRIAGGRHLSVNFAPGRESAHRIAVAAPWPGNYVLECAPDRPGEARCLVLCKPAALVPA